MTKPAIKLTKSILGIPCALLWCGVIAIGMLRLVEYQMIPGAQGQEPPHRWPANVLDITRGPGQFTLVMLLHPKCPCSRASLHELSQLMARADGRLSAHILFTKPPGAPADWCDGDLWKQAAEMPGVNVSIDNDATDASIFGASTSGHVMVYDASGAIRFSGGITDGRGHEGDNSGLGAILDLIRKGTTAVSTTPVYGCPLGVCPLEKSK